MKNVTPSPGEVAAPTVRLTGRWVRTPHEWYGEWLRPIPGARPEVYDPLTESGHDRPAPLWRELLDLNTRDPNALQAFYSQRGPLGILRHHVIEARFRPTRVHYESGEPCQQVAFPGENTGEGPLIAVERHNFVRVGVASMKELAQLTLNGERAGVVLWQELSGTWRERSLENAYAPFFPTLDGRSRRYPSLNSEDFWRDYAETTEAIERALGDFRLWVHGWPFADADLYLSRAHPIPVPHGNGIAFGWAFPSLLSLAAVGLLRDAAQEQTRVCRDPACGKLFRPTRSDKKFCSIPCGNRFRGRKLRSGATGHSKGKDE
ncbi:MAG: hypothetical protein HY320_05255 [Armatimonadetes bacterium]|nr:hypothetical protein [Armatimonadota bacterium]